MGLTSSVKLCLELWQRGVFEKIDSVCDMGSQELHLTLEEFEDMAYAAQIPTYKRENFLNLKHFPDWPRCSAKPFYEMLGVKKYTSIDINGMHGAISLDLNLPLKDSSLDGQFDLVTDFGNNEHAFNIAEAYRTMHRICKTDGYMIIDQAVLRGNGYFCFDRIFFEGLAAANNYKILYSAYVITTEAVKQFHIPASRELLNTVDLAKINNIGICYVMQKQSDDDFKYAYQDTLLSKKQKNIGYQLQFILNPPAYLYVPKYSLNSFCSSNLLKELIGRLGSKIKSKIYRILSLFKKIFKFFVG